MKIRGFAVLLLVCLLMLFLAYAGNSNYIKSLDFNKEQSFKLSGLNVWLKPFQNYVRVFGSSNDSSYFFSYRFNNPPVNSVLSFVSTSGEKKTVALKNIPEKKGAYEEPLEHYEGKIQKVLLENDFLRKEGYESTQGIPVVITFNTGYIDAGAFHPFGFDKAKSKLISEFRGKLKVRDLRLINGVATRLSQENIKRLVRLNIVRRISLDKRVHTVLLNSTRAINGTATWQLKDSLGENLTGKGKKIAIIDTGVDYTHPDLGRCLGSGCKVIGGYDFVNYDSDPMDDQGHGTHCAAIAAGNGTFKGVAPGAKILAYKVLDSTGSGSMSDVIAGIERSIDPNQDGDYSDHADVISLSLGGPGSPDDEISKAVDAAVNAGAVVVVAAGNSGPYGETISSPGCARKAITVGAACMQSQIGNNGYCEGPIASFSSRGPTALGGIKPDVVAPGVKICAARWGGAWEGSECHDDSHVALSGTSMAAPHVAGAAALLLQANNWTPTEIKSMLMATATELGVDPNSEGTGQINILLAHNASVATFPQSIGFGFAPSDDFSSSFILENIGNRSLNLTLNVSPVQSKNGSLYPFGSVNSTTLELLPGENKSVELIINISHSAEGSFFGKVFIDNGDYNSSIPFTFVRLSSLTVVVKGSQPLYPDILIHNQDLSFKKGVFQGIAFDGDHFTFQVPSGNYTVYAVGDMEDPDYEYMLMDTVSVPENSAVTKLLSVADARPFTIRATSLGGKPLKLYKWEKGFITYLGTKTLQYTYTDPGFGDRTVFVSDKPDNGANTDIMFNYHGIPTEAPYSNGGVSRSIG